MSRIIMASEYEIDENQAFVPFNSQRSEPILTIFVFGLGFSVWGLEFQRAYHIACTDYADNQ
ncbi:hypothetical protein BWI97_13235 [Siphonobacter sp. BAB-5405]|nr:hypothetical protein BWI97_13235 [Siphonobacter sp. BAB-5405]